MRLKADLTLLLVSLIWGSAFVAQRVAGQMGSVYLFNAARYLLAAVVVLPFAKMGQTGRAGVPVEENLASSQYTWMFIAGFFLFAASAAQQVGLLYTTAGNAGFITSLYVVLVPILLFLVWRERWHWVAIVPVLLAGAGTFLLSTGGSFQIQKGDVIELVGALFWTLHVIILGKYAAKFPPMSFSVGQLAVCGIFNLAVGMIVERSLPLNTSLMWAIVYTAFFSLGLCYTLQIWAQRHTPPADAALLLSLESVFSVISGWLLLKERLVGIQMIGCGLIFAAVLLSQFKERNLQGTTPDASSRSCDGVRGTIDHHHLIEGR